MVVFLFKQKTAYEMRISDWVQTCALPIYGSDIVGVDITQSAEINYAIEHDQRGSGPVNGVLSANLHSCLTAGRIICPNVEPWNEIGRASCRERVCQYV